MLMLLM